MQVKADSSLDDKKFIFGSIFLLSNRLQALGDQTLAEDDMTLRQWFLTVMILQFDERQGPTLGDVARLMGTSHQNVKQMALKLQQKEFLVFEKDESDGRVLRLKLTEKSKDYWKGKEAEQNQFLEKLYKNVSDEEVKMTVSLFKKLFQAVEEF
ncbi:MAG: MarR family transcriptional regulator [Tindallia sp. MSAO_Bac2]|nr:MAG: MarR family transcriptional regulator [Tindallia sp. MSAO_Bac2]